MVGKHLPDHVGLRPIYRDPGSSLLEASQESLGGAGSGPAGGPDVAGRGDVVNILLRCVHKGPGKNMRGRSCADGGRASALILCTAHGIASIEEAAAAVAAAAGWGGRYEAAAAAAGWTKA